MATKVPSSLKPIAHYIKIANENSTRDPVVYYWCLFYAVQTAMQLDKSSPEALQFLTSLLGTLEAVKKQLAGTEAIANEVIAQAHLEDFALKLFNFADAKEKNGHVDKSVVHAFYTAGHVMDVLSLFGEVDESLLSCKKYAKWKSTQIFACLKDGTPYTPSIQQEATPPGDLASPTGSPALVEHHYSDPSSGSTSSGSYQLPPSSGEIQPGNGYPARQSQRIPHSQPNFGYASLPNASNVTNSNATQLPQSTCGNLTLASTVMPELGGLNLDSTGERKPSLEAFNEARKFTKYALSAIDYEDTRAVVENLRKALALMERF